MAVEILGRRMHDDVGAVLDRPRQHRRRHRGVDAPAARRRLCAISAAAAMSVTAQVGLAGVSIQTSLVAPGRTAAAMASVRSASTNSTFEAPLRRESCEPVAQRPVHHLRERRHGRPAPGQGSRRSRRSCRTRRSAPWGRLRARPAWPRPGRRSDCRRAHRCGRSDNRCPRRADRCSPCGSAARRPSSPDRSSPSPERRAMRRRSSCRPSGTP